MRYGPYLIDVVEVELELLEDALGTAPANPEVYLQQIGSKAPKESNAKEEADTLPDDLESRKTVFHRDSRGVFLFDYQIRGFLKETANRYKDIFGIPAMRDKVEAYTFVHPRRVYFTDSAGLYVREPGRPLVRPLREPCAPVA